jgi:hypothetical protein
MANNRLYIVDKSTKEFLCIAKGDGCGWAVGNYDLYSRFMNERFNDGNEGTNLLIGTENDDKFFDKWIVKGKNYNTKGGWEYG